MIDSETLRAIRARAEVAIRTDWEADQGVWSSLAVDVPRLCDEVEQLNVQRDALRTELHRWQHGEQIEGDYVCLPAAEAQVQIDALRAALYKLKPLHGHNCTLMHDCSEKCVACAIDVALGEVER